MKTQAPGFKPSHHIFPALLVFIIGAFFSMGLYEHQKAREFALIQERFTGMTNDFKRFIELNVDNYEQALNGVSGLFNATNALTQTEWDAYIQVIQKANQHYPGIVDMGFSITEPKGEIVHFVRYFAPDHHSLMNENLQKYPNRHRGIQIADKTNQIALVSQVHPLDPDVAKKKTYFALFKPIYQKDRLYGHAFMEVDFEGMMAHYLNGRDLGVLLKVFYKIPNEPDQILYQTPTQQNMIGYKPLLSDVQTLTINKISWNLFFSSTPMLDAQLDKRSPAIVFFSCIVISFLGAIVTWALNTVRSRSELLYASNKKIMFLNR